LLQILRNGPARRAEILPSKLRWRTGSEPLDRLANEFGLGNADPLGLLLKPASLIEP